MRILLSRPFRFLLASTPQPASTETPNPNMIISGMHAAGPGLPRSNVYADFEEKFGVISGAFELHPLTANQADAGPAA